MPALRNKKHESFCHQVAGGMTYAKAYEVVGYKPSDHNASKLACNPEVAARITELEYDMRAAYHVTPQRVIAELAKIGFADITEAVEIKRGKVKVKDTADMPKDLRAAISEIREGREGIVVKLHEKVAALEKLGKHLSLFTDRSVIDVNVSLADLVAGSYRMERGEIPVPRLKGPKSEAMADCSIIDAEATEIEDSTEPQSADGAASAEDSAPDVAENDGADSAETSVDGPETEGE